MSVLLMSILNDVKVKIILLYQDYFYKTTDSKNDKFHYIICYLLLILLNLQNVMKYY